MFFCITVYCCDVLLAPFTRSIIEILLGTNVNEANEFLTSINISTVLLLVISTFLIALVCYLTNKIKLNKIVSILLIIAAFVSFSIPFIVPHVVNYTILEFFNLEKPIDLRNYEKDVPIVIENENQPENIVLIIGESHSSLHNSLNGYEKLTNPNLEKLRDFGLLTVFQDAESPAVYTVGSFKYMMTTMKKDSEEQEEWYKYTTLPYIMRKGGYKTYWVSNQCKRGLFDNIVSSFSEVCDTSYFIGKNVEAGLSNSFDGDLIDVIEKYHRNSDGKKFFIVNLMGSHIKYSERFPDDFKHFKAEDYSKYKKSQRQIRADYDNSILYTDYVVSSIMKLFENSNSIVLYLSDHGEDVYETSDDMANHGVENIPESYAVGIKIPFIVYTTNEFKMKNPCTLDYINDIANKKYCTEDIFHFIMRMAYIEFKK